MGQEELAKALWASVGMTIAYVCGMFGLVFAWLYYRRRKGERGE